MSDHPKQFPALMDLSQVDFTGKTQTTRIHLIASLVEGKSYTLVIRVLHSWKVPGAAICLGSVAKGFDTGRAHIVYQRE